MPKEPTAKARVPPGARYENDCPDCILLEQFGSDDLYYCKIYEPRRTGHARSFFAPMLVVVKPDGGELTCPVATAPEIGEREPRITRALSAAREKGLISGDPKRHHLVAMADEHRVEPNALKAVLDEVEKGQPPRRRGPPP